MSVGRYTTHVHMLYISVPKGYVSVENCALPLLGVLCLVCYICTVIYTYSEATTTDYFVRPYIRP